MAVLGCKMLSRNYHGYRSYYFYLYYLLAAAVIHIIIIIIVTTYIKYYICTIEFYVFYICAPNKLL